MDNSSSRSIHRSFRGRTTRGEIMHSKSRIRSFGAVIAASAFIFAACGGDDGGSTATNAPSTDTATTDAPASTDAPVVTEPAGSPVLVVAIVDVTGVGAGSGPFIPDVINAWADWTNANGGLGGHPVEVDIQDTAGDPAKSQTIIADAVAKSPVLFLLDDPFTEASMSEALGKTGVPVMGLGYDPSIWGGHIEAFKLDCTPDASNGLACALPNAFPLSATFGAVVDAPAFVAQALGAKKTVFAVCAEATSCSAAGPVWATTVATLGMEDIGLALISSAAADYTAECLSWIDAGVDFINMGVDGFAAEKIMTNCDEQGYTGTYSVSQGSVAGSLLKGTHNVVGAINGFPWWVDDAPVAEYRSVMDAAGVDPEGYENPTATGIWAALQMFAKANATLTDAPTAAETLANMYTIKDETLGGLVSPTTWTEGETAPPRNCWWNYSLTDGKIENPLGGLAYQCNPAES